MSTGSLISSLFRENSFSNRSSSLFQKSFGSFENSQQRARSQSTHRDRIEQNVGIKKYLPLGRMVHTLARKVQKQNYFLFVRLQAHLKKYKAQNPIQFPKPQLKFIQSCSTIQERSPKNQQINLFNKEQQKQERKHKAIENIVQLISLNQLKRGNNKKIQMAFERLRKNKRKSQATQNIVKSLFNIRKQNFTFYFKQIQKFQKSILRTQIFISACVHIFQPKVKVLFNSIRNFAIQNKIQEEIQERERKQRQKFIDLSLLHIPPVSSRLNSIEEQSSSSVISQEDHIKFITPEKNIEIDLDSILKLKQQQYDLKTSRKQNQRLFLNRKSTRKQFDCIDSDDMVYLTSSKKRRSFQNSSDQKQRMPTKLTTKIQPHRQKIFIGKAYKIETALQENRIVTYKVHKKHQQAESMLKHNRLYTQSINQPLPDLHDNMGVFQYLWSDQGYLPSDEALFSQRTIQKAPANCQMAQNQRTIGLSKQKRGSQEYCGRVQQKSMNQSRMVHSNITKQSSEQPTFGSNSRAMSKCKSNPKYILDTVNNTSSHITGNFTKQNQNESDQFYSSPLQKIEEMMMDLQRLREKEKYSCKYVAGYQKCKISVNLPSRKSSVCEGKSYQGSANKTHCGTTCKNTMNQCRSEKKQLGKDQVKRFSYKENNEPKDNIQVKLWNEKNNFLFYPDPKSLASKQKRKSSRAANSMTQSQINTARKMKKQIESIINNRKNRTSLGDLKLVRGKY